MVCKLSHTTCIKHISCSTIFWEITFPKIKVIYLHLDRKWNCGLACTLHLLLQHAVWPWCWTQALPGRLLRVSLPLSRGLLGASLCSLDKHCKLYTNVKMVAVLVRADILKRLTNSWLMFSVSMPAKFQYVYIFMVFLMVWSVQLPTRPGHRMTNPASLWGQIINLLQDRRRYPLSLIFCTLKFFFVNRERAHLQATILWLSTGLNFYLLVDIMYISVVEDRMHFVWATNGGKYLPCWFSCNQNGFDENTTEVWWQDNN